ncbi:lipopolysaccharide biosynthesis protein [Thomasclavelia ramosa]|nr:polysaccharide biosynthesis C-terminal domain-containing protein [Thomasclavelia ramosa]QMW73963.1 hypothetical protein EYR00_04295 [Thomasclavelia ramosa DSM 1402]QPS12770.1 polysaccharide biosynthesis C-terminal domain-containing protein [Thomasclavelia ramosa]
MNRNKYLLKNTFLYSISTFSTKIITFFMVSFYTAVLSAETYGKIDVIFATINLLIPIVALSINNSILRFSLDKNINKNNVFFIGFFVTSCSSILIIIVSLITNIFINNPYFILSALLLIFEIYYLLLSEFIRGLDRNGIYVLFNVLLVIIISLLNIFFLGYMKLQIFGYLYAYLISYGLCSIFLIMIIKPVKLLRNIDKSSIVDTFKIMLNYCVYLIPNSIFWWITTSSDKYIIVFIIGNAFNGVYSVANKIPTIVIYTFQIFIQAWQLSAIKEKGAESEQQFVNQIFKILFVCISLAISFILLILKPFTLFYVGKSYYEAWESGAILVFTAMFNILSSFVGIRYVVEKDNKMNMYTTLLGAVINIILNIILIPHYKLIGAAIATLISYIFVFMVRMYDTKKYLKINMLKFNYLIIFILVFQVLTLFIFNDYWMICGIISFFIISLISILFIKDEVKKIIRSRR